MSEDDPLLDVARGATEALAHLEAEIARLRNVPTKLGSLERLIHVFALQRLRAVRNRIDPPKEDDQ